MLMLMVSQRYLLTHYHCSHMIECVLEARMDFLGFWGVFRDFLWITLDIVGFPLIPMVSLGFPGFPWITRGFLGVLQFSFNLP